MARTLHSGDPTSEAFLQEATDAEYNGGQAGQSRVLDEAELDSFTELVRGRRRSGRFACFALCLLTAACFVGQALGRVGLIAVATRANSEPRSVDDYLVLARATASCCGGRLPALGGCPTVAEDECCRHLDERPGWRGEPCVRVSGVTAPDRDVGVFCQPIGWVIGPSVTEWRGTFVGCGQDIMQSATTTSTASTVTASSAGPAATTSGTTSPGPAATVVPSLAGPATTAISSSAGRATSPAPTVTTSSVGPARSISGTTSLAGPAPTVNMSSADSDTTTSTTASLASPIMSAALAVSEDARAMQRLLQRVRNVLAKDKVDSASMYGVSLFCFAVMLPWSNEIFLLQWAFSVGANLFGCEHFSIYSSQVIKIAPGVSTVIARNDLRCEKGGEFKTALNTDIFIDIWRKVVDEKTFLSADWTVKVDPDTVFFAPRLRRALAPLQARAKARDGGVYLNNCKFGMHGPLEVVSRAAVGVWVSGIERCKSFFRVLCSGDCRWGEDMFMDQCFQRQLDIERINNYGLLLEDHCDPPPGWETCRNRSVVAFHPFKEVAAYAACLKAALL